MEILGESSLKCSLFSETPLLLLSSDGQAENPLFKSSLKAMYQRSELK